MTARIQLLLMCLLPALAAAAGPDEVLLYETRPRGKPESEPLERVRMTFAFTDEQTFVTYVSRNPDGVNAVEVVTRPDGTLIAATNSSHSASGRQLSRGRIWPNGQMVHAERRRPGRKATVKTKPIAGRSVVADAGMCAWIRHFPFEKNSVETTILMSTFSLHFVEMQVRKLGEETIRVKAGRFDCYKLEAVINLIVHKHRTTYWIEKAPPHRLIRYEGRRGILITPVYVTELVATGDEAVISPDDKSGVDTYGVVEQHGL